MSAPADQQWLLATLESQQRLIRKVCWAYTRSPDDHDDLYQEIVIHLLSAARTYDRARRLSTWVYRIALNVAIDYHRRRARRRKVELGLDGEQHAAPDRRDAVDEQLRQLRDLLEQRSDVEKALLMLHLDGNSYREIGEILGISETNVGTRLSRLKKDLRESH